jgi:tetratricopeptide (TPR) repeat protein
MDSVKHLPVKNFTMGKVIHLIFAIMVLSSPLLFGEELFERAERLFMENQPAQAVPALEEAIQQDPGNEKAYLYLGIAYEQLEQFENALSAYQRGLNVAESRRETFYFNMGNNYLRIGKTAEALEAYGKSVSENGAFAQAYLNRGNLQVKEGEYQAAVSDYQRYLTLKPQDPQKDEINRMIALLSNAIQDRDRQRLEDERKRQEEEARQKELLDRVLGSLESAGSGTSGLSAGSEDSADYEGTFDIMD